MEDGFTYRYSTEEPLYPFGFGLSYTSFKYETLEVEPKVVDSTSTLTVTVGVRNSGPLDANEVSGISLQNTHGERFVSKAVSQSCGKHPDRKTSASPRW